METIATAHGGTVEAQAQDEGDGALTLFVQHRRPEDEAEVSNWLPSPEGPFTVIIRAYGGDTAIAEGTYRLPDITPR